MTNRNTIRPYSAGVAIKTIKKPRLRRFNLTFDGPPPPTPEGTGNGIRPHGGYRGMRSLPPGQFTFNKGEEYQQELEEEYRILVNNENYESHGAPYWLNEVQREITNSGESPLFTNNLLSSGKFEQEQGEVNFERAVLYNNTRRPLAPHRRHLNGRKEYYRPNSTHQYLSATDLRNLPENEENMIKYGRPTRTTLLRARQRTNSAPVNAYDLRRENNKRTEDVKNNSIFHTSKEYLNIYATEGESIHSFLTGARYNRAHLVDSKGLMVYGVYMPRGHPSDCFITGPRRLKDVGDEIPSAPPDSPRSDIYETQSTLNMSRPTSSRHVSLPPSSRASSGRPATKHSSSRPHSYKKPSSRLSSSSLRPRSAKDFTYASTANTSLSLQFRSPVKSPDKKDLPLPDEVTMAMPDHINKGKQGVYVTLRGQKIIESVDSKLPRVTGVSLPKIQKPRDYVDEMLFVNQPPPTPCDVSVITVEKPKCDTDGRPIHQIEEQALQEDIQNNSSTENSNYKPQAELAKEEETNEVETNGNTEDKDLPLSKVVEVENLMTDKKSLEIGPVKKVNFENLPTDETENKEYEKDNKNDVGVLEVSKKNKIDDETNEKVLFFITEDDETDVKKEELPENKPDTENANDTAKDDSNTVEKVTALNKVENANGDVEEINDTEDRDRTVVDVIKVEISETEKNIEDSKPDVVNSEDEKPLTSKDYPFDGSDD